MLDARGIWALGCPFIFSWNSTVMGSRGLLLKLLAFGMKLTWLTLHNNNNNRQWHEKCWSIETTNQPHQAVVSSVDAGIWFSYIGSKLV